MKNQLRGGPIGNWHTHTGGRGGDAADCSTTLNIPMVPNGPRGYEAQVSVWRVVLTRDPDTGDLWEIRLIGSRGHSISGCALRAWCPTAPNAHCPPFRLFSHSWHGKTGKAPPTPPGGLGVHAVHMLQLHPRDQMLRVPSGEHSDHGPWRLVLATLWQRQWVPTHTVQQMSHSPPNNAAQRVWTSVVCGGLGTSDGGHPGSCAG